MLLQRMHLFALLAFAFFVTCSIAGAHLSLGLLVVCVIVKAASGHWSAVNGQEGERTPEGSSAGAGLRLGIEWPVLALAIVGLMSTALSEKPFDSFHNLRHLLTIVGAYGVAHSLRWQPQWRWPALWTFIGSATIFSLFGLWEYAIGISTKVQSTQGTTMTWGALSVVFMAVTLQVALASPQRRDRWLARLFILPQIFAMFLSLVRGAYVGFFFSMIFMLRAHWTNRRTLLRKILPATLVLIVLGALFAPPVVRERIGLIFDLNYPSTQVRLVQWKYALRIAADHPVAGVGWRDMQEIFRRYAPQDIEVSEHVKYDIFHIGHFHNSYIMILVIFGAGGLAAFLWLLVALWRRLAAAAFRAATDHDRLVIDGARAAIVGFLVASFFDWTFGDAEAVTMFWFVAGLGLGQVGPERAAAGGRELAGGRPDNERRYDPRVGSPSGS